MNSGGLLSRACFRSWAEGFFIAPCIASPGQGDLKDFVFRLEGQSGLEITDRARPVLASEVICCAFPELTPLVGAAAVVRCLRGSQPMAEFAERKARAPVFGSMRVVGLSLSRIPQYAIGFGDSFGDPLAIQEMLRFQVAVRIGMQGACGFVIGPFDIRSLGVGAQAQDLIVVEFVDDSGQGRKLDGKNA